MKLQPSECGWMPVLGDCFAKNTSTVGACVWRVCVGSSKRLDEDRVKWRAYGHQPGRPISHVIHADIRTPMSLRSCVVLGKMRVLVSSHCRSCSTSVCYHLTYGRTSWSADGSPGLTDCLPRLTPPKQDSPKTRRWAAHPHHNASDRPSNLGRRRRPPPSARRSRRCCPSAPASRPSAWPPSAPAAPPPRSPPASAATGTCR